MGGISDLLFGHGDGWKECVSNIWTAPKAKFLHWNDGIRPWPTRQPLGGGGKRSMKSLKIWEMPDGKEKELCPVKRNSRKFPPPKSQPSALRSVEASNFFSFALAYVSFHALKCDLHGSRS